jgi:serpin B
VGTGTIGHFLKDIMAVVGPWLRGLFGTEVRPSLSPAAAPAHDRPTGPASFAEDGNDFALAMFGELRQLPGNLFFSPFSIRAALGMAHAGARGETAAQMREALRISSSDETQHMAFAETAQRLGAAGGGEYEMVLANSLWCDDAAPLLPGYLDLIARHYGGGINLVDFRRAAEAARITINRWVEDQTRHKIRELIPSGGVDGETRLVLVNAIYFKGAWLLQFRSAATRDERFFLQDGGTVQAPLMHQHEHVRYRQAAGFQAVDLAYRGNDLSMLVLLPDRRNGLRDLENTLSARMLQDCVMQMGYREVELFVPRFKITWGTANIRSQLTALGMTLPFDRSQADFCGINGRQPANEEALFISAVLHKAFVEVNEEGTEAAAATAGAGPATSAGRRSKPPPVPVFRADHPFLFAIRDRRSGAFLFLGRMADPTRER